MLTMLGARGGELPHLRPLRRHQARCAPPAQACTQSADLPLLRARRRARRADRAARLHRDPRLAARSRKRAQPLRDRRPRPSAALASAPTSPTARSSRSTPSASGASRSAMLMTIMMGLSVWRFLRGDVDAAGPCARRPTPTTRRRPARQPPHPPTDRRAASPDAAAAPAPRRSLEFVQRPSARPRRACATDGR